MVEDIWPLLTSHSHELSEVLLLRSRRLGHERLLRTLPEVQPALFSLGSFKDLDSKKEGFVRVLSHYGGHLNVLFRTDSVPLLRSLVELWPLAAVREDDALGLEPDEHAVFSAAVVWATRSGAAFAFFHDGYPMLVFGAEDLLVGLHEHHLRHVSGRARS
jgi:hypothetical protein